MKKYRMKMVNNISETKWARVTLTHRPNHTTNSTITPAMFKRECEEYDSGKLPLEHERYIGELNE